MEVEMRISLWEISFWLLASAVYLFNYSYFKWIYWLGDFMQIDLLHYHLNLII